MRKKRRKANKSTKRRPKAAVTLDTAMQLHRTDQLAKAEQAYRQVLVVEPDSAQTVYLLGVVTKQLGRPDEAMALFQRALSLQPDFAAALAELAKLYQEQGRPEASAEVLRRLIALKPDLGDLYNNLGIVLRRLNRPEEARAAYLKAIDRGTGRAETHYNLGCVLRELDRHHEATVAYRKAIALDPKMTDAHRCLASVLRSSGKLKEAGQAIEEWLGHDPDNSVARHMLSAFSGRDTPLRASDDYIRSVFGDFAATYDEELRQLGYQGPPLIAKALSAQLGGPDHQLNVLDAGCGTGLCGPVLRPYARQLTGVDLSAEMIDRARELNVYDDLVVTELTQYLKRQRNRFDLIVAADTFIYFGDLEELLAAATDALRSSGFLIFTLELLDESSLDANYRLNPNGRYTHTEVYIKRCASQYHLEICAIEDSTLRIEKGQPVKGIMVQMRRR
jgi:predicted TPR repeat methyltransferase